MQLAWGNVQFVFPIAKLRRGEMWILGDPTAGMAEQCSAGLTSST